MSISYQRKLLDLRSSATRIDTLVTTNYQNFYIHSGVYDGVEIHAVTLIGCAEFLSKSLPAVKARIRQFKRDFGV
jgi:hypothetical protein